MTIIYIDIAIAWVLSVISNFFPKIEYEIKTTLNSLAILWLNVAVFLLVEKVG